MTQSSTPKFGILLPTREVILSGRADPGSIYDLADRAEALGFHSVWVGDSVVAKPRLDALTTLAAVGARTRRIRLGTAVYLAALRNPVLVAHMVGTVDWLSRGRADLGIGYARPNDPVQEHEYRVLGHDPARRIKMSEELVEILRKLWRENDVSYAGAFLQLRARDGGAEADPARRRAHLARLQRHRTGTQTGGAHGRRLAQQHHRPADVQRMPGKNPRLCGRSRARSARPSSPGSISPWPPAVRTTVEEGRKFLSQYYNRPYEAVAKAMLCVMGDWAQVMDQIQAYHEAGARTFVLRFATSKQLTHLENCAEQLRNRGYLSRS